MASEKSFEKNYEVHDQLDLEEREENRQRAERERDQKKTEQTSAKRGMKNIVIK